MEHAICIYGQLLLLDLLEKLEPLTEVINLNTEGIKYKSFVNDAAIEQVLQKWEQRTKMHLSRKKISLLV